MSEKSRQRLAEAASGAFIAMCFALEHWDQFCAWAERHSGDNWTDMDRAPMQADARLMDKISDWA